jgi:Arc/MetJ-type ribon-helix-helix transcriptional regulator
VVGDRAISVRLDEEATRALRVLMSGGQSQSEAIRVALLTAAREQLRGHLAEEAAALAQDEADRVAVAEVQEFMEKLSAAW